MLTHWILRVYLFWLAFFPRAYREEYAIELVYSIRSAVAEGRGKGRNFLMRLAWRELRDLPFAMLRAHLRERRGNLMKWYPGSHLPDGPIKNWRLAALFTPFLLPLFGALIGLIPGVKFSTPLLGVGYFLAALVVLTWIAGLVKGFPSWALPALGMALTFFLFPLRLTAEGIVLTLYEPGPDIWPDALTDRLAIEAWVNVAYVGIAVLMGGFVFRAAEKFQQRVRQDWTLLSFLFYGLSIPYVLFGEDPYRGRHLYLLGSSLILIAGAMLFVILPRRWQRVLALLLAVLLAHPLISFGIYQIFPMQDFATPGDTAGRVWEALQPVIDLPALVILLCLPALIQLLRSPAAAERGHEAGIGEQGKANGD